MVIPPAKTGKDTTNKIAVKNTPQINKGSCSQPTLGLRRFLMVQRKLIDPPIEDAPAICNLKMAKSTLIPGWPTILDIGG
jgi:hypothetical protein